MEDPVSPVWRLDKRIPISLITAILLQTFGGIWWARGVSSAIEYTTLTQVKLEARIERIESDYDDVRARVIRIEEKIGMQGETLKEILGRMAASSETKP